MGSKILNFTDMPEEVILYLIKFLPHSDRCTLRVVSTYFNKISHYYSWLCREKLIVKKTYNVYGQGTPHMAAEFMRPYISIVFDEVDFSSGMYDICKTLSPNLRDLTIIKCDISERDFTNILVSCNKLESLSIISCNDLLMSGSLMPDPLKISLPDLKCLVIENCNHMTDSLFTSFLIMCPNIHTLGLRLAVYNFHPSIYKRFYNTDEPPPSSSVFTIKFLLSMITRRAKLIKNLDFSYTFINDDFVERLCTMNHLTLNKLNLGSCYQLRKNDKKLIGSWQPYITELNVSDCFITDCDLLDICKHMLKLHEINISKCSCLTEAGIRHLQHLKELETLYLSHNSQLNGDGLVKGICKQVYSPLEEINVKLTSLKTLYLSQVIINLPNICILNLQGCSGVNDSIVQLIFKNLQSLKEWYVSDCWNVTNEGLTSVSNDESLENFVPEYAENFHWDAEDITRNYVEKILSRVDTLKLNKTMSISSCKRLTTVDLCSCPNITDKSLVLSFYLTDLRAVDLSSTKITTWGLLCLVYKCPRLEHVNVNNCDICDSGVIFLIKNLHRLVSLHLRDCCKLTNVTIEVIAEYAKVLRILDLSGYNRISKNHLSKLKTVSSLQEVRFRPDETQGIYFPPPVPPLPPYLFS